MRTGRAGGDKVGLVGVGMVGASFAYALMQSGIANELILIDADRDRADGEAMDLNHGLPFVRTMGIRVGEYPDLAGCDVVVVCAGANQRPGQTRLDLLRKNANVMRDVVPKVVAANPDGIVLIASNPVDILTLIAAEALRPATRTSARLGYDPRYVTLSVLAGGTLRGRLEERSLPCRG